MDKVTSCSECGNEPSVSIKYQEFLQLLRKHQPLKQASDARSSLNALTIKDSS
jgi:hypothetical protein